MRGGKNCIHSNHIRERHRVLRNQLNGEKLALEGDRWSRRMVGVGGRGKKRDGEREGRAAGQRERERERASRLLCQVDEAGKDEKTDGERRNLQ